MNIYVYLGISLLVYTLTHTLSHSLTHSHRDFLYQLDKTGAGEVCGKQNKTKQKNKHPPNALDTVQTRSWRRRRRRRRQNSYSMIL